MEVTIEIADNHICDALMKGVKNLNIHDCWEIVSGDKPRLTIQDTSEVVITHQNIKDALMEFIEDHTDLLWGLIEGDLRAQKQFCEMVINR